MPALHPLETALAATWPPQQWQDVTVLLAVSGGADSVALLRAMRALKTAGEGRLAAAHLNHLLRNDESAEDETFVVELCRRLGVPCEVGRAEVDQMAARSGEGLESAARSARYEFLQRTAARLGARYVVTAHSADDQAETILHRIVRGTGVRGLVGMARARTLGPAATLMRPLLGFRRAELAVYLNDLGQPYRSDSSNHDLRYTRNRIRHELLPQLAEQFNPAVIDALLRLGSLSGELQVVVDKLVEDLFGRCVVAEGPETVRIDAAALSGQPSYLIRELLATTWRNRQWPMQSMGFAQWDLLAEMVLSSCKSASDRPAKRTLPGNVLAESSAGQLRLTKS